MKTSKIFTLLLVSSAFAFFSCSSSNDSQQLDENMVAKTLKFKSFGGDLTLARGGRDYVSPSTGKLVIVNWEEWGRHSKQCRGWGLCNARWFYLEPDNPQQTNRGYSTPLQFDGETGEFYLEILLAEDSTIPNDEIPDLKIDSDIPLETALEIGRDLTFKQGSYSFDPDLGEFGGIHITLE
ncbi:MULTISPECIES: hypothetical protein [unclassified Flavobacterium]|uniref:hypothetical protein n=1 Tax=unclassified Flavobacterium TaxID=196869 RepID=UPI001F13CF04|nr:MULTISPECIES: hypothetical protein [unclassified Flavobacterium]UMY64515.1 hypothetical protein MKO97_08320 [Flavobacterium sp. HJ-32-4]